MIVLYEPEELIISVRGEILLNELENILAEYHQWIPTLVASEHTEEILSNAIEEDHYHPRAQSCGMLRTTILGGTFTSHAGEMFKSGSRVVKSVAGYDIHRAFCGSKGKFGKIDTVTLKVQARPEAFYHFFAPLSSKNELLNFFPTITEEYNDKLFIELAGYKEDIEHDKNELQNLRHAIEEVEESNVAKIIKHIILRKSTPTPSTDSDTLLDSLRSAFTKTVSTT